MPILLGNAGYRMGNQVVLHNLKGFCFQCIFWDSMLLASGSQVWVWPACVHPWRLRRKTLGGDAGMSRRIICRPLWGLWMLWWRSVVLFSSYSMMLGRSAGICLVRVGCTWWGTWAFLVIGYFCGVSNGWYRLAATLEKISESWSIAIVWDSPMLENWAFGAGFYREWANLCAAMMIFSEEEL